MGNTYVIDDINELIYVQRNRWMGRQIGGRIDRKMDINILKISLLKKLK